MSDETYTYEVLEPGGHARLVGNVLDRISRASTNPASAVGSATGILGDPETASWMECTTAADGAALIEAVYGNTIVQDGSLLPVRMEGVETVGFNLLDPAKVAALNGVTEAAGVFSGSSGAFRNSMSSGWEGINYIPGKQYEMSFKVEAADSGVNVRPYVLYTDGTTSDGTAADSSGIAKCVSSAGKTVDHFSMDYSNTGNISISQPCINVSDPARNGTYEPYWSSERAIPVATYFPQGMRSAGSVADELTETQAITRVGAVDLGTLTWLYNSNTSLFNANLDGAVRNKNTGIRCSCAIYTAVEGYGTSGAINDPSVDKACSVGSSYQSSTQNLLIRDTSYTDPATFKAAMSGVLLYYELATPTTTPIDPPLPLSYRTGKGGTERVMVASGTTSAPPIFVTRYPLDPADLAASIAPRESATAEANHAVGDLVMLGWTLCKVTTAIARGESITIGNNVTRTSVAAEIAALS